MNTDPFKICPTCATEGTVALVTGEENVEIRGESFVVPFSRFKCNRCEEEFEPLEGDISLPYARDAYRVKHGMLRPEEMIAFRKKLDVSQPEFAMILGWGTATVSRYENGKLQEPAHDKELRLVVQNPENLLELVHRAEGLAEATRNRLISTLEPEVEVTAAQKAYLRGATPAPAETLSIEKLSKLVILLCEPLGQMQTKLNKLLFYVDFKMYKQFGRSVSTTSYQRLPYGPVPASYRELYTLLAQRGDIDLLEEASGPYEALRIVPKKATDRNYFDENELSVIIEVKRKRRAPRFQRFLIKKLPGSKRHIARSFPTIMPNRY